MRLTIEMTIKIPAALRTNERSKNCQVFILERPKTLTPNSSGIGEAIMAAPTIGKSQIK